MKPLFFTFIPASLALTTSQVNELDCHLSVSNQHEASCVCMWGKTILGLLWNANQNFESVNLSLSRNFSWMNSQSSSSSTHTRWVRWLMYMRICICSFSTKWVEWLMITWVHFSRNSDYESVSPIKNYFAKFCFQSKFLEKPLGNSPSKYQGQEVVDLLWRWWLWRWWRWWWW